MSTLRLLVFDSVFWVIFRTTGRERFLFGLAECCPSTLSRFDRRSVVFADFGMEEDMKRPESGVRGSKRFISVSKEQITRIHVDVDTNVERRSSTLEEPGDVRTKKKTFRAQYKSHYDVWSLIPCHRPLRLILSVPQ